MSAAGAVASGSVKPSSTCFNPDCTDAKPDRPRKGWRLRNGDQAELCDRCASIYEEGRFCETFHHTQAGWRICDSCRKRVHCGCIVSAYAFTLLDPGGIECMACVRKNLLTSNPAWPPSLYFHGSFPDRVKDISTKNWNQLPGTGPVPWRQAPSLFNSSMARPELQPRPPYEIESSTCSDRFVGNERYSASPMDCKRIEDFSDRLINANVQLGTVEKHENGAAVCNSDGRPNLCLNSTHLPVALKEEPSTPQYGLTVPYTSANDMNGHVGVSGSPFRPAPPPTLAKHIYGNVLNDINSSSESQIRNGRPRGGDVRGRSQLLPRYYPRITDQELQRISGDSNSVITPLFEKMLSASDAGKIGRLVLPKKCAEAYFPPISQPEGLPLKVQDAKGSEWIFQFRFWPNNNSRMYVLEGVTPCIQSMQLQAGDIVTFSRLEPEGKLIMGFRKASTAAPSEQENEVAKTGSGPVQDAEVTDPTSWSKVDKSGYIAKEALVAKPSLPRKRKSSSLGSKSKRLRIENEDLIELKLTWEEAQVLLRPPPNQTPSIVVIEGFEFEEYEDAPVLGKPTLFADNMGGKIQWVQCEDCLKWRKLPSDAFLPSKWTCSDNCWDTERSQCSAAQELTKEQLEDLLQSSNPGNQASSKKLKTAKLDINHIEALEGLDTLANLAILGEGESIPASSQVTTKHPRHRPGCSCIVCIQPPSGKGPKHKQTCTCNVCQTVKRRFHTLMLRREKKQSEKEAETSRKKPQKQSQLPENEKSQEDDPSQSSNTGNSSPSQKKVGNEGSDDDPNRLKSSSSPFKGQIDLNMQPEKEEELSPGSDSGGMMRLLQDATDKYMRQRISSSDGYQRVEGNNIHSVEDGGEKLNNDILDSNHQERDGDHPATLKAPTSASLTI